MKGDRSLGLRRLLGLGRESLSCQLWFWLSAGVELSLALMAVLLPLVVLERGCLGVEVHKRN